MRLGIADEQTTCIVGILQLSNCISGEVGTICVPFVLVTYTHLCVGMYLTL